MSVVQCLIEPREKDLGEFSVRRLMPSIHKKTVGPWIFFDHMGPAAFAPNTNGINVRPHPHINLATVTYLFDGEILHRDSIGSEQAILPGDINLMVAGKGITHSERERDTIKQTSRTLHALQLWLALPEEHEETDPAFYHYPSADIPAHDINGVTLRVMIGAAYGAVSPVKTFSETLYVEADIPAGKRLALPTTPERALYVAKGSVTLGDTLIPEYHMAVITPGAEGDIVASDDARIAIIGGASVGERFIEWNFVSSRKERIAQAKDDWKHGRFPTVPGDDGEFIPLPGE